MDIISNTSTDTKHEKTSTEKTLTYLAIMGVSMITLVVVYALWGSWTGDYFSQNRGKYVFDHLLVEIAFTIGNLFPIIGLSFIYRAVNPSRTKSFGQVMLEHNAFLLGALVLGSIATALIVGLDELPMTPSDVTIMRDMFTLLLLTLFTLVGVQHFNEVPTPVDA